MINDMMKLMYRRLIFFKRYRDTPSNMPESIAEHSYFVTLIAKILCDKYKLSDTSRLKVLEMAMIHDCGESYSDDFTYSLKYGKGSENFRESLEIIEDNIVKEINEGLDYRGLYDLYDEYKRRMTLESKIVKLADWYSVLLFCETELTRGENKLIRAIYEGATKRLEKLEGEIDETSRRL